MRKVLYCSPWTPWISLLLYKKFGINERILPYCMFPKPLWWVVSKVRSLLQTTTCLISYFFIFISSSSSSSCFFFSSETAHTTVVFMQRENIPRGEYHGAIKYIVKTKVATCIFRKRIVNFWAEVKNLKFYINKSANVMSQVVRASVTCSRRTTLICIILH